MFVEIFITIPFINGIELGLQDTGGMVKLGCDQKSGPLNHASIHDAIKTEPIAYDNSNSSLDGMEQFDFQYPSQHVKVKLTDESDTKAKEDMLEFGTPSQATM